MDQHSQINELTDYDAWFINMAVKISYDKSIQCSYCVSKTSESYREKRGCKSLPPRAYKGFRYSKCQGNFYNFGYAGLIELHNQYRNGVLFCSGGLSDQPSKYLQAMSLIGSLIHEEEKRMAEESAKRAKNKKR